MLHDLRAKIAVFAALTLLLSFQAQSGAAQATDDDRELARTIAYETARARGWDATGYTDTNPEFVEAAMLGATYTVARWTWEGMVFISVFPDEAQARDFQEQVLAGVPVLWDDDVNDEYGGTAYSTPHWLTSSREIPFHEGTAVRADESGTTERKFMGWVSKNFFLGCYEWTNPPLCAEVMYQIAAQHGLGQEASVNPGPAYPDPDPNPNPNPNPNTPDVEQVIQELVQAITNPAVPLTGAVAGTLLAALIAALRGAGQVPIGASTAVRGGPKPGTPDAQGRLYSPVSGGYVSPQMYEYQKTWSEKGWRWNPSSGKFEGQHGAINEQGQVMDDELGWVDQQSFAENQRMRAEGNVYDRNLGWRPPEELRDLHIEQNAIRQRSRLFSAAQNAQIQQDVQAASQKRIQEYQDWLKQYEHKEQVRLDMDAAQDEFRRQRAIDNQLALKEFLLNAAAAPVNAPDAIASRLCPSVGEVYQGAYDGIKEAASDIKEFYKGAYQGLKETAGDIKDFYQGEIQDGYDVVKEAASDIKDFYKGAYDELKETAGDIKDFYHGEIRDTYDGVKEAAAEFKDLVIHDDIHAEWKQAISGRDWDWTPNSTSTNAPAELIR